MSQQKQVFEVTPTLLCQAGRRHSPPHWLGTLGHGATMLKFAQSKASLSLSSRTRPVSEDTAEAILRIELGLCAVP